MAYMPFHIFLAQSLSLATGGLDAWKIAKDLLAIIAVLFVICSATESPGESSSPPKLSARNLSRFNLSSKKKLVVTYESSEPPLPMKAEKPKDVDGDFILYVGTAFPHKNLPKLIEAFNIIRKQHPALKLVLAGKREKHYDELQLWAFDRPSYNNIIFTGFVSDAELKWLYQHCKAYVFASLSEGFGLPPLEAMAHGAPVVSSNASVMPEVYGDAAYYCDPHSSKDIAGKVHEVITNAKLRDQLIKNGHEQLKKYSWRTMAEETMTVYKAVLGEETTDTPQPVKSIS